MQHLTSSEELELITIARQGEKGRSQAIETLMQTYEGLLRTAIKRLPTSASVSEDDLMQEARLGLLAAVHKFDPERGVRFSTMVYNEAKYAASDASSAATPMPIPGRTGRRYAAAWAETDDFDEALEMAMSAGMGEDTFRSIYDAHSGALELDRPVGGDSGEYAQGADQGMDLHAALSGAVVPEDSNVDALHGLLAKLSADQQAVIKLYYGIDCPEALMDSEIAAALGMSRATVQRRRTEAMELLQERALTPAA